MPKVNRGSPEQKESELKREAERQYSEREKSIAAHRKRARLLYQEITENVALYLSETSKVNYKELLGAFRAVIQEAKFLTKNEKEKINGLHIKVTEEHKLRQERQQKKESDKNAVLHEKMEKRARLLDREKARATASRDLTEKYEKLIATIKKLTEGLTPGERLLTKLSHSRSYLHAQGKLQQAKKNLPKKSRSIARYEQEISRLEEAFVTQLARVREEADEKRKGSKLPLQLQQKMADLRIVFQRHRKAPQPLSPARTSEVLSETLPRGEIRRLIDATSTDPTLGGITRPMEDFIEEALANPTKLIQVVYPHGKEVKSLGLKPSDLTGANIQLVWEAIEKDNPRRINLVVGNTLIEIERNRPALPGSTAPLSIESTKATGKPRITQEQAVNLLVLLGAAAQELRVAASQRRGAETLRIEDTPAPIHGSEPQGDSHIGPSLRAHVSESPNLGVSSDIRPTQDSGAIGVAKPQEHAPSTQRFKGRVLREPFANREDEELTGDPEEGQSNVTPDISSPGITSGGDKGAVKKAAVSFRSEREKWLVKYATKPINTKLPPYLSMEEAKKIHDMCVVLEDEIRDCGPWSLAGRLKKDKLDALHNLLENCTDKGKRVDEAYNIAIGIGSEKESRISEGFWTGSHKANVKGLWRTSRTEDLLINLKVKYDIESSSVRPKK